MFHLDLSYKEIYPRIFVYTNMFPDFKNLNHIMQVSEKKSRGKGMYTEWTDWFVFGKYCHSNGLSSFFEEIKKSINDNSFYDFSLCESELDLYFRINESVTAAISNYVAINNVTLPSGSYITDQNVARYDSDVDTGEGKTMQYHTDYAIGEWYWPGDKFLITATTYMNDDYDGGEIIFSIGSDIIKYKPKAGDIIVFPSGSPLYPGGEPYFHAVDGIKNGKKSLVRMYVKHFQEGFQKWYDGEKQYGKEQWYEIAKTRSEGHNTAAVFEGQKRLCSALITKLYNIPYDSYQIKDNVFYDEDEKG